MTAGSCMTGLKLRWVMGVAAATVVLGACSSRSLNHAPVEDRASLPSASSPSSVASVAAPEVVKMPQGYENAGKPGYYTVKPGDTLIRIALEVGQSWKDVARWSQVENPNLIEVGQVLRVVPPVVKEAQVKPVARPVVVGTAISPMASSPADSASQPASAASPQASAAKPVVATAPAVATSKPALAEDDVNWIWPANGALLAGFDEIKNKGVDIAGKAGDPVLAAADGRVVYVGSGLRGYGNLIILKHNNVYLSAYAHNQTLLVKEDQTVRKGQKIAEMGNSDADRVKLHFEVRRQGKPVDPIKYLPAR